MNKAQKITIGISLLGMLAVYFNYYNWISEVDDLIVRFTPVILLGGAVFTFFSLKKR